MTEFIYKGKKYRIENIDEPENKDAYKYVLLDVSKIDEDAAFDDSLIAEFSCNYYERVDAAIRIIEGMEE